ncbi:hypothetical protein KUL49_29500 [Alteromonas sp. KUL49]|nr:hypothetical protein KUL49_29500 [Alteromonas sp. KUL49]
MIKKANNSAGARTNAIKKVSSKQNMGAPIKFQRTRVRRVYPIPHPVSLEK